MKVKKIINLCLIFTVIFSLSIPVSASTPNSTNTLNQDVIEEIFYLIENTPDDMLINMSNSELMNYFNKNSKKIQFLQPQYNNSIRSRSVWQGTKCGAAVLLVVGGTVFAGTKLVKFKKYIQALGGAKEAAYLVYLYIVYQEVPEGVFANIGSSLMGLAGMILGIDDIQTHCAPFINKFV